MYLQDDYFSTGEGKLLENTLKIENLQNVGKCKRGLKADMDCADNVCTI